MTQKRRIPRLLQMVLIILGVYLSFILVFDVALGQLIPKSLLTMYMLFVVAGVVMVFTFTVMPRALSLTSASICRALKTAAPSAPRSGRLPSRTQA